MLIVYKMRYWNKWMISSNYGSKNTNKNTSNFYRVSIKIIIINLKIKIILSVTIIKRKANPP